MTDITIKLQRAVFERLQSSAAHRGMSVAELVANITTAVVARGSINEAIRVAHGYNLSKRALGLHVRKKREIGDDDEARETARV
jgi:predicted DNA-binding ribbon-helix-helix protein